MILWLMVPLSIANTEPVAEFYQANKVEVIDKSAKMNRVKKIGWE